PAVVVHGDKIFNRFCASATDENYFMVLLLINVNDDPRYPANWHKSPRPFFTTIFENRQYGPVHNSFTQTPDGEVVLVYHARN
ncbi:family 43 glycosylhydrolase, partial [Salmonella enterica]|uniref:family 43 glycosylhydrolase n=1 Tax=Salmonella enterica TaxID=28901 RepID=UPI0020C3854F